MQHSALRSAAFFFFFFPSHFLSLHQRVILSPSLPVVTSNSDPRSHSGPSSHSPTSVRAFIIIAKKSLLIAFSYLVDSRRIVALRNALIDYVVMRYHTTMMPRLQHFVLYVWSATCNRIHYAYSWCADTEQLKYCTLSP